MLKHILRVLITLTWKRGLLSHGCLFHPPSVFVSASCCPGFVLSLPHGQQPLLRVGVSEFGKPLKETQSSKTLSYKHLFSTWQVFQ